MSHDFLCASPQSFKSDAFYAKETDGGNNSFGI